MIILTQPVAEMLGISFDVYRLWRLCMHAFLHFYISGKHGNGTSPACNGTSI